MNKKPRVLITYMESGMGHITSADGISQKLQEKYGDEVEILNSYIMQEDENQRLIRFERNIANQVKWTNKVRWYGPFMFGMLRVLGGQKFMELVHHVLFHKSVDATIEAMRKRNADVIVANHYFTCYCANELKKRYMPSLKVITYNPDNNVHVWWDNRSELFITNNDNATKEAILKRKFQPEAIRQVPLSIRRCVMDSTGTKAEYREKYNLPDQFTVILADGAYASARAGSYTDELLKTDRNMTILTIAGKNEKLYRHYMKLKDSLPKNITFIPLRFQPQAYELYGAADLFITKAGPNSILDSICMGTPVMVNYYAHPIEKASARLFVDSLGCGVAIYNKRKARKAVEDFADHPEKLDVYRQNLKRIDRYANGAEQVADIIMQTIFQADTAQPLLNALPYGEVVYTEA